MSPGVNLPDVRTDRRLDLPWKPMRLVQRHGRIDRMERHPTIWLGCFFPADHLDALLSLSDTLQRKLAYAETAIGVSALYCRRREQAATSPSPTPRDEIRADPIRRPRPVVRR